MALSGDYAGSTGEKILTTSGLKALVAKINGLKDTWTKDTFLDSVSTLSDENKVTFTWNTGSGKTATTVDFGKLVDIYKLENAANDKSIAIDGDGSNANPWKISTKGTLIPLGAASTAGDPVEFAATDTVTDAIKKLNAGLKTVSGNVGGLNFCKKITSKNDLITVGNLDSNGNIDITFNGKGNNITLGTASTTVSGNGADTYITTAIDNAYTAAKDYVDKLIGELPDDKDTTYTFTNGTADGTFTVQSSTDAEPKTITIGGFAGLKSKVATLESTVGNSQSGLVKELADLTTKVNGNSSNIESLQTTVGNASSGLVKDVNSLKTDMTTVKGYETRIAALESAKTSLEERVAALETALARIMTGGDVDTIWDDTKLTW